MPPQSTDPYIDQPRAGGTAGESDSEGAVAQAQQKAGQVADQARQQATSRLDGQKDRAAEGLQTVAQAVRQTGQELRQQQQPTVAQYTDQAAQRIERLASYLRQRDVNQIVEEAEGFARRRPTLFVGGGLVLGLLARSEV